MSSSIPAEAPQPLPPMPSQRQVSDLAQTLAAGFKSGRRSARALKLQYLKAKLDAMRLAPVPASPREALARAREAARMARDAKDAALDPETGQPDPSLADSETEARRLARAAIAKARKGVVPGSREDAEMERLQLGLGADPEGLDVKV